MKAREREYLRVIGHRALTEVRLSELLKNVQSTATLDDIKNLIFNETGVRSSIYLSKLLSLFNTPLESPDIDTIIPVVQDAWNYFPHRRLNGQCPAELFPYHRPGV